MNPAQLYILNQEEPFKTILLELESVIKAMIPEVEMQYKWRIPFFVFENRPVCYLNQSKDYVDFCFWTGNQIDKYQEHFVTENRKAVSSLRYKQVNDVDNEILVYVLKQILKSEYHPFKKTLN